MAKINYDRICKAEKAQKGGKYRLIAQRQINGHQCRCFARVFMVGIVAYWNVFYIIDGKEAESYNEQIRVMYELAQAKADALSLGGKKTIMWRY